MFKKKSASWKIISDLKPDDTKVMVIGRLLDKKDDFIIIDDSTGTIVVYNNELIVENSKKIVLIIGTVHQKNDNQLVIEAENIRNFDNLNFELYLKTYELFKKNISPSTKN